LIEDGCVDLVEVLRTPHGAIVQELCRIGCVCGVQSLLELAGAELRLSSLGARTEFVECTRSPRALYAEHRFQDLQTQARLADAVVVEVGRLALPRAFRSVGPLGVAGEEGERTVHALLILQACACSPHFSFGLDTDILQ